MKLATLEALCERLGIFADRFTEAFCARKQLAPASGQDELFHIQAA